MRIRNNLDGNGGKFVIDRKMASFKFHFERILRLRTIFVEACQRSSLEETFPTSSHKLLDEMSGVFEGNGVGRFREGRLSSVDGISSRVSRAHRKVHHLRATFTYETGCTRGNDSAVQLPAVTCILHPPCHDDPLLSLSLSLILRCTHPPSRE